MFTPTALSVAIGTVILKSDPLAALSRVSGVVAQYAAASKRGAFKIEKVMELIAKMKATMNFEDDIAELRAFMDEAEAPNFHLSTENASAVVDSLTLLIVRTANTIKAYDSWRQVLNAIDAFSPHQNLVNQEMLAELRVLHIFKGNVLTLIQICGQYVDNTPRPGTEGLSFTEKDDASKKGAHVMQQTKFDMALARAGESNKETLRALADK